MLAAAHSPLRGRPHWGLRVWPCLLAAVAGVCQALALAWPWGVADADWVAVRMGWSAWLWPAPGQPWPLLQVLAMAVCVGLVGRATRARQAGALAWVFATAWLAGTFWWLFVSMHTHGGLAAPLAVLAVLGLAAVLALYSALFLMLYWHVALASKGFVAIFFNSLTFAACWALAELARGALFTGFPWGAVGYAHVDSLAWAAPWVGVQGMGALAAALAAACAGLVSLAAGARAGAGVGGMRQRASGARRGAAVLLVVGVSALLAQGPSLRAAMGPFTQANGPLPLRLLQGNIAQKDKFESGSGVPQALAWYGSHLGGAAPVPVGGLVVAPETALPLLPQQLGLYWPPLLQRVSEQGHAVMLGLPVGSLQQGYANAVWAISPRQAWVALARLEQGQSAQRLDEPDTEGQGSPVYRYEKHHLVPFGEFVPPMARWFVDLMDIPLGDFRRGRLGQAPFEWGGQRIAPNICYEDLFGEELARNFVHAGSAPTVLVNLSNLAWFGNTVALDQHLHISRVRALELERPMVRATNTGATVVIDHMGHVTHALPRLSAGVLAATVQGRNGLTPYARWASRWGHGPLVLFGCFVLLAVWLLEGGIVRSRAPF